MSLHVFNRFAPVFRVSVRRMHSSSAAPLLLSPKELNTLKTEKPVAVLDATWFMPNSPKTGKEEFHRRRIPGAQFLDLDHVASPNEMGLKHMMPSFKVFAKSCESLGITPSTHVVLYDAHGVFSSPRALFMFRSFGHKNSSVLNGGLPLWAEENLPIDSEPAVDPPSPALYHSRNHLNPHAVKSYEEVVDNSTRELSNQLTSIVLDARSKGRYDGIDPEPRPGLSSGHIPNSISLPFNLFLQKHQSKSGEYTTFLPPDEVRKALEQAVGVEETKRIIEGKRSVIASCGSGMSAGVLWLGLQLLGAPDVSLYDESWTGYAMRPESIIQKTEA